MKYSLINCYSDNNKGDLGIIQSTIDYIKENDEKCQIIGISTYNFSDPLFHTEHNLLKKKIEVYPSIFGELNIGRSKNSFIKIIRFCWDTIRIVYTYLLPVSLSLKLLFSANEKKSLHKLINSDYIVSKGGSFICNNHDIRSKMALIRFLYIFLLSLRLKKKVIILNQSIGPVYGKFSIKIVNFILNKCHKVVLRESICIAKYKYLDFPKDTFISNDIAFYLKPKQTNSSFSKTNFNIGITMKFVEKNKESDYQNMWIKSIENILENYKNINIVIFNQVPIDNDLEAAWLIYKKINDIYKNRIFFLTNQYESSELKYLCGEMDLFIGTRLHSTIFAMGELVPSIVISYHGTKAEGIFKNMQFSEFVIQNYDENILIEKFIKLYENRNILINQLKNKHLKYQKKIEADFRKIFNDE